MSDKKSQWSAADVSAARKAAMSQQDIGRAETPICRECRGLGEVHGPDPLYGELVACPVCKGKGTLAVVVKAETPEPTPGEVANKIARSRRQWMTDGTVARLAGDIEAALTTERAKTEAARERAGALLRALEGLSAVVGHVAGGQCSCPMCSNSLTTVVEQAIAQGRT